MAGGKGREEGKRSFFATCPDNSMISFYINSCMRSKLLGRFFKYVGGRALDWHAKGILCRLLWCLLDLFLRMEWVFEVWTLWLSVSFHKNHDEESKLCLSYSFEKLGNYLMIHSKIIQAIITIYWKQPILNWKKTWTSKFGWKLRQDLDWSCFWIHKHEFCFAIPSG